MAQAAFRATPEALLTGDVGAVLAPTDRGRPGADGTIALRTAAGAIEHVLERIRISPEVGYYMGYGTQSFQMLCEAYAGIHGKSYDDVEELFHPLRPRDPTASLRAENDRLLNRLTCGSGVSCCDDPVEYGPQNLSAEGIRVRVQELLGLFSPDPERCVREIAALYDLQQLPINLVTSAP